MICKEILNLGNFNIFIFTAFALNVWAFTASLASYRKNQKHTKELILKMLEYQVKIDELEKAQKRT